MINFVFVLCSDWFEQIRAVVFVRTKTHSNKFTVRAHLRPAVCCRRAPRRGARARAGAAAGAGAEAPGQRRRRRRRIQVPETCPAYDSTFQRVRVGKLLIRHFRSDPVPLRGGGGCPGNEKLPDTEVQGFRFGASGILQPFLEL